MKSLCKGAFQVALVILALYSGMFVERALADQPHMQAAKTRLQAALDELKKAEDDKGGHKVTAISLINEAIEQVQQGILDGRDHE